MSRIGKLPIEIPASVKVNLEGNTVTVNGPKGTASRELPGVNIAVEGSTLVVTRPDETRQSRALHGLSRSLLNNMVQGVSTGFERKLEVIGVGYRAEVKGNQVHMALGYSHPVIYDLPEGVSAEWKDVRGGDKQGELTLRSADKDQLGRTAAEIRALRAPEPYKGKGVKYFEETIRRKAGKTGAG